MRKYHGNPQTSGRVLIGLTLSTSVLISACTGMSHVGSDTGETSPDQAPAVHVTQDMDASRKAGPNVSQLMWRGEISGRKVGPVHPKMTLQTLRELATEAAKTMEWGVGRIDTPQDHPDAIEVRARTPDDRPVRLYLHLNAHRYVTMHARVGWFADQDAQHEILDRLTDRISQWSD